MPLSESSAKAEDGATATLAADTYAPTRRRNVSSSACWNALVLKKTTIRRSEDSAGTSAVATVTDCCIDVAS